jgi:hypothetical protein
MRAALAYARGPTTLKESSILAAKAVSVKGKRKANETKHGSAERTAQGCRGPSHAQIPALGHHSAKGNP